MKINDLLRHSAQQLQEVSDSPRLDAEILLAHCLQKPRSFLYTWPEHTPAQRQFTEYTALLQQRLSGQPIAYLTGQREFWGMKFKVTPDTLIPRPETELLVETALEFLAKNESARQKQKSYRILDLGTGSGAIAIALSSELTNADITASDQSAAALTVAQANADRHQNHQQQAINFLLSDWFSAIPTDTKFDLIVSNPPYIASGDIHLKQGDVRFEPQTALASGPDGLNAIRHIISHAHHYLAVDGLLLLEHGYDQATAIRHIMQQSNYVNIRCQQDLAGNDRVSCGHYNHSTVEVKGFNTPGV